VKANAAKQGYSPDHDMIHTVPDGFYGELVRLHCTRMAHHLCSGLRSKNDAVAIFEEALEHFKEGSGRRCAGQGGAG
jgi:hypothetical protein